jgi:hypothetical protein
VFEVVDGEIVRTKGTGVGGFLDGINDGSFSKGRKGGVERMLVVEFSDDFAGGFVGGVAGNGGKLLVERVGYVFRGGEDFGTKGNGLVG